MIHYTAEVGVARPAADVFAAVNDIAGWTAWTDMREISPEGTGPVRVGSAGTLPDAEGPVQGADPLRGDRRSTPIGASSTA